LALFTKLFESSIERSLRLVTIFEITGDPDSLESWVSDIEDIEETVFIDVSVPIGGLRLLL